MTVLTSRYYPAAAQRFTRDTDGHVMTVLHDDALYRHVRFRNPEHGFYWYDLVTWPGYLAISGDYGDAYTFARLADMFEFFDDRSTDINPGYWGEKIRGGRDQHRAYSPQAFRHHVGDVVREHIEDHDLTRAQARSLWAAVRTEVLDEADYEETARPALDAFRHGDLRFTDTWEWDLRDYTWQFLWACCAIRAGVREYRAAKAPEAVAA